MQLGERIMIIGSGGAGKSTLARQLGELLPLPVIHLDAHFWRPGWVETPKDEWRRTVDELAKGERWIIDGNYGGTLELRMAVADTVIFLDYSTTTCLWRACKRMTIYRKRARPDITPGCEERLNWPFLHWIWTYRRRTRSRVMALLAKHEAHLSVHIHTSPAMTRRFLAELAEAKSATHA